MPAASAAALRRRVRDNHSPARHLQDHVITCLAVASRRFRSATVAAALARLEIEKSMPRARISTSVRKQRRASLSSQRRSHSPAAEASADRPGWKGALRQPVVWILTLILSLVTSVIVGVAGILFAPEALIDLVRGGPAVTAIALVERDQQTQGEMWALPDLLEPTADVTQQLSLAGTQQRDQFRDWIRGRGGVDVGHSRIKLIVQSRRIHKEVRITGMRAITKCGPPLGGTLLYAPTQAGVDTSQIGFDLDSNDAVARTINPEALLGSDDYLGKPFFDDESTLVASDQAEIFQVSAFAQTKHCEWVIELQILADGEIQPPYTVGVGSGADSIHTTAAILNSPSSNSWDINFSAYKALYSYEFDQERFLPQDPQTFHG